jgi:hypothetical protein
MRGKLSLCMVPASPQFREMARETAEMRSGPTRCALKDQISFEPGSGKPVIHLKPEEMVTLVKEFGPGAMLQEAKGRGRAYGPMYALFGQPVEMSPIGVASAGLNYLAALVAEAEAMCTPSQ